MLSRQIYTVEGTVQSSVAVLQIHGFTVKHNHTKAFVSYDSFSTCKNTKLLNTDNLLVFS
jgi:hypothetical protein